MAQQQPLMPKATAVWLIDNTSLTFDQIADFCILHPLEVKGIADGDVAAGVRGLDPVTNGQLTREEIEKAEADDTHKMTLLKPKHQTPEKPRKGAKYTPLSKRQERPNAILWMVRNHPEVPASQIAKLLGTTKPTIEAIRDRTHWNMANIQPQDPVGLGLCKQSELDMVVRKAAAKKAKLGETAPAEGPTLQTAEETLAPQTPAEPEDPFASFTSTPAPEDDKEEVYDADKVFGSLNDGGEDAEKAE
ncbi:MAG: cell cycle transcriptional regulator TrcR [Pseudomonadota bacterium]